MIGLDFGSILIAMLVTVTLFVYVWVRSHGITNRTYLQPVHVDAMAGDEGED